MAGSSLLALIDDIATILDDVAVLTKVAAQKTAGVLGDDLALNAQQVAGVRSHRELPVVWAVAKGSFVNKLILVPAALAVSAVLPALVTPLLMLGGAYLCYEGFEKLAHRLLHGAAEDAAAHGKLLRALAEPGVDLAAWERDRIRGAVRTDFILSAEIIVIALGAAAAAPFATRFAVLSGVAVLMTVGVYGLVAVIVKLDDLGLYLHGRAGAGPAAKLARAAGAGLLRLAPRLMQFLSVAGMAAMFLVGGGILVHGIAPLHHAIAAAAAGAGGVITELILNGLVGVVAGAVALALVSLSVRVQRAANLSGGQPG